MVVRYVIVGAIAMALIWWFSRQWQAAKALNAERQRVRELAQGALLDVTTTMADAIRHIRDHATQSARDFLNPRRKKDFEELCEGVRRAEREITDEQYMPVGVLFAKLAACNMLLLERFGAFDRDRNPTTIEALLQVVDVATKTAAELNERLSQAFGAEEERVPRQLGPSKTASR